MSRIIDYQSELSPRRRMELDEVEIVGSPEALNELYQNSESFWYEEIMASLYRASKNIKLYNPKTFNNDCNDVYMLSCSCVNEIMNSL